MSNDRERTILKLVIGLLICVFFITSYISCHNLRKHWANEDLRAKLITQFDIDYKAALAYEQQGHYDDAIPLLAKQCDILSKAEVIGIFETKCKAEEEYVRLKKEYRKKTDNGWVEFEGVIVSPQERDRILLERKEKAEKDRIERENSKNNPVPVTKENQTKKWFDYSPFEFGWQTSWRSEVENALYCKPISDYSIVSRAWRGCINVLSHIVDVILLVLQCVMDIIFVIIFIWILDWFIGVVCYYAFWLIICALLGITPVMIFGKK